MKKSRIIATFFVCLAILGVGASIASIGHSDKKTSKLYSNELPTNTDSDDMTLEEITTLAMKSYIAYGENDWEGIYDYSDIELYCYLNDEKWYTREEYLSLEDEQKQTNGSAGVYLYGDTDTFVFETPQLMSDDEVENLNNFIISLNKENPPTDFQVEKAYAIKLKYNEDSDIEYVPKIYVFKVNGIWEADIIMSVLEASIIEMITEETN